MHLRSLLRALAHRSFHRQQRALPNEGKFTLRDPKQAEKAAKTVPLNISFTFPLPPLPLMPGCTYRWILEAQDKEVASVAFTVRTEPSAV
ncbi:hypothetical protein [Nonomuraea glycinis]|uniref:hypothetical protein n=1 Tax=Nonomuraea glycinis TaxID=2047744 RepID=UPI0033AD2EA1